MTLNDLERLNSLYFGGIQMLLLLLLVLLLFSGRLYHSGWRYTSNIRKILSPSSTSTFGENYNAPCSAVSLR